MGELKNKINKRYKKIESSFFRVIEDFKNFKEIGIKKLFKRNRSIIAIVSSIIIIFVFIFFLGVSSGSKEDILNNFQKAIITGNYSKLARCLRVENQKVSPKDLEPLVEEYDNNEKRIKKVISEINSSGKSGNFELIKKEGFFNNKYYINVTNVTVDFTTNLKNVAVEFGNKKFMLLDEAQLDVIPGIYNFKYTYNTEYGDITESKEVNLMENQTIKINVDGNYITLYSNFEDSKVFVNDKDTGLLAKDIKNYGPLPKDADIKIHLEREFPWGNIKSDQVEVNSNPYIKLDIDMVNDELNNMIDEVVNKFYDTSFQALNSKDKNKIEDSTDEVKDIVYNYFNEKGFLLSNNYEITDLVVEIEKSDFKYEDNKYKASVLTKVNYSVYKKLLPFIKSSNESYFILNLEYEERDFLVKGIQKVEI